MPRGLALAAICLSARVLPLGAQGLPCAEFPVNTHTLGHQTSPALASAPEGRLLVAWVGDQDGGVEGVSGRLYDASGTPEGAEFRVNTFTASNTFVFPSAASDGSGNFVVVWMNYDQDGSQAGVFGQRLGPDGAPQGTEFRVNTYTESSQSTPKVAAAGAGGFVVVWRSDGQDGSQGGIFGQRYDVAGAAQGPEFQVNTHTPGPQSYPAVSVRSDGQFVVVWQSFGQDADHRGVFGQRFDAAGTPQGGEFPIHTFTTLAQAYVRVAHRPDGGFVTVWIMHDGNNFQTFGRTFGPSGDAVGPAFLINTDTSGLQDQPAITRGSDGGFVVVWTHNTLGGAYIAGRRLDSSGAPLGPEFAVAGSATDNQSQPHVAATPNGGFVAAWQSEDQDGSGFGVFASRDCARLYTVAPCRVADTRGGPPLQANAARSFSVSGLCGIPADARAVVLNATAVNPSEAGNLRLYPAGQAAPLASALNFTAGLTRANNAIVPLGTAGQVAVQCDMAPGSSGSTNLVLDVFGYFKR